MASTPGPKPPIYVETKKIFPHFDDWLNRYRASDPTNRKQLIAEGLAVARVRRAALKDMIRTDPEQALELALPFPWRQRMPRDLLPLLETPVDEAGAYEVTIACALVEHEGHEHELTRHAVIGQQRFEVFTYGRRLAVNSKDRLSLSGIAIDEVMALSDSPVRVLSQPEQAARGMAGKGVAVMVYGEAELLPDGDAVKTLKKSLEDAEFDTNPASTTAAKGPLAPPGTSWTEGPKTVLYLRVDFPNLPGEPVSITTASNWMDTISEYMEENSYGRTTLTTTFPTNIFRMPTNSGNYGSFSRLMLDARTVAASNGYDYTNYDLYIVCSDEAVSSDFDYAGKAWVGSAGTHVVEPHYRLRTVGHELGHNFGLRHAQFWQTDSESPIGKDSDPGGYVGSSSGDEHIEYGHRFSVMSAQGSGDMNNKKAHFTAAEKERINWLSETNIAVVTNHFRGRLYRHDDPCVTGEVRAIHIDVPSSDYTGRDREYWLSYRYRYNDNIWLRHGLQVDWLRSFYGSDGAIMLDMTPFSNDSGGGTGWTSDNNDKWDGVRVIGRTYSDDGAGIHFTAIRMGGPETNEWLEVEVNVGAFPSNTAPTLVLTASTNAAPVGGDISFTAIGNDVNGDELVYYWDFGVVQLVPEHLNAPNATNRWSSEGEFVVRCTVSDMKGGVETRFIVVTIGNPTDVYRLSGRV
ncbi:MAG: PKD domain-containing protein, partial [Verrucomicrobiota bacterium]